MYEIPQERSILLRIRLVSLLLLLALLLPGCAAGQQTSSAIAATTAPVAEFAEAIVQGSGLSVTRIITDSVSCLHDYSLSVRQMEAVERCDVLLLSGAGLEDFMADVIAQAPKTIDCSEGIALLANDEGTDPHIWLDPTRAAQMAANIADGLTELYPDHADLFADNLQTLTQRLTQLQAGRRGRSGPAEDPGTHHLPRRLRLPCRRFWPDYPGRHRGRGRVRGLSGGSDRDHRPGGAASNPRRLHRSQRLRRRRLRHRGRDRRTHFSLDMGFGDRDYFDAMTYNLETLKEALS